MFKEVACPLCANKFTVRNCPLCGGDIEMYTEPDFGAVLVEIRCKNCGCSINQGGNNSLLGAMDAWNKRKDGAKESSNASG